MLINMAENIQVLRLEISGTTVVNKDSNDLTPGQLLTTGAIVNKIKSFREQYEEMETYGVRGITPNERRLQRSVGYNVIGESFSRNSLINMRSRLTGLAEGSRIILSNLNHQAILKNATKGASAATAGYAMYSQYKSIGYNLSGASHAAQIQQRRATTATFATGIGISIATGQYWATGLLLAGRAWQLSQQNRQELFEIKKSQIIANIMQERLVKDTIQRRF
jgi:hypothetical protein